MKIAVVGLGLIGGSMAKAIQSHTDDLVYGTDKMPDVVQQAMETKVIDGALTDETLAACSVVILALYPADTNYYFYALNKSGVHTFSETYYEHQEVLAEMEH